MGYLFCYETIDQQKERELLVRCPVCNGYNIDDCEFCKNERWMPTGEDTDFLLEKESEANV